MAKSLNTGRASGVASNPKVCRGVMLRSSEAIADTDPLDERGVLVTLTFNYTFTPKAFVQGGINLIAEHCMQEVYHLLKQGFTEGIEPSQPQLGIRKIQVD